MANHNYSQYSNNGKKNKTAPAAKTEVEAKVNEVSEIPVEVVAPDVKMEVETVETKEVSKVVTGTVANCTKLNVRAKPSLTADVVTVVNAGEKVTIDVAKSNREWFYVSVDSDNCGYNGYCMKKFVTAKL